MAKKSKEIVKQKRKEAASKFITIKSETRYAVFAVISFIFAIFFIVAMLDGGGVAGNFFHSIFGSLFGFGYIFVPILLILLGISFLKSKSPDVAFSRITGSILFLISILGMIDIVSIGADTHSGGFIGRAIAYPFMALFDTYISLLFLGGMLVISLLIIFDTRPSLHALLNLFRKTPQDKEEDDGENIEEVKIAIPESSHPTPEEPKEKEEAKRPIEKKKAVEDDGAAFHTRIAMRENTYTPPPLSLLEGDKGKPDVGDIKANSNIIKRTLSNFGIEVEMDEITVGPTVTRYALKPAEGVKLSRIVGLQNDLALALAAHPIRIEAPIPGKSLVGIEIPNRVKSTVGLATMLSDEKLAASPKPLMVALGRSITGKAFFGNLAKMPHMLIAGATGSGKSVTIHSIVTSLLYRNSPEELEFIMVDPKRVELTLYNKIPHLLTPVITDAKKCILALKWAAKEMDRRYDILETESVRDIESYHTNIVTNKKGVAAPAEGATEGTSATGPERMPYIVIIIDELADIMQTYPRELESSIVRLAQMSRAVGIHLILSTQRPSVNVITGLIKANVPARIALQVSSQIDSRTILDAGGAEKLLGAGDMLYESGDMSQPERLQSAFISEEEVKKVVKFLADHNADLVPNEIAFSNGSVSADKSIFQSGFDDEASDEDDELYEEARQVVIEAGKASTSYLQRKLKLGYARAARLIDMLEERGVVGPGEGAKPREVIEKPADVERQDYT